MMARCRERFQTSWVVRAPATAASPTISRGALDLWNVQKRWCVTRNGPPKSQ
jgi:hypothetical protein